MSGECQWSGQSVRDLRLISWLSESCCYPEVCGPLGLEMIGIEVKGSL